MNNPILYLCQASKARYKRYRESHKSEINQRNVNKKNQRKREILENRCCSICGLIDIDKLVFHHIDSSEKECNPNYLFRCSIDALQTELIKCVIVCKGCHIRIHRQGTPYSIEKLQRLFDKILETGRYLTFAEQRECNGGTPRNTDNPNHLKICWKCGSPAIEIQHTQRKVCNNCQTEKDIKRRKKAIEECEPF